MDNNFTLHAAFISAIAAITAPVVTALIHSIKEYAIHKNSSVIHDKITLIEKFTNLYMSCPNDINHTGYCLEFYKCCNQLIPLCKWKCTRKRLFKIANYVRTNGVDEKSDKMFNACIFSLAHEV